MVNAPLRVFVSSVQVELEDERVIVQNLISTDSFLSTRCAAVLYEYEPASADNALEGCLTTLDGCQVYLLIVGSQYGTKYGDLSITHAEYRRARQLKLPILAFIKGPRSTKRDDGTAALIAELEQDGPKYKRFQNVVELQKEVRAALVKLLADRFGASPTSDENAIAEQTIEATSTFESQTIKRLRWDELDHDLAAELVANAEGVAAGNLTGELVLAAATVRGLAWLDPDSGAHYATAAGVVLLGRDPSATFPQCRILADAYPGSERVGDPSDFEDIRGPLPRVIERAIAFVDRNTRHPTRIVRLDRVRLDEYPVEALREALVNAAAHRRYDDSGRKTLLEVRSDRVVVSSPGYPPAPLTVARLRSGKYRPCSRNPVLAQCLSYFHRIEERGSGMRRMNDLMLDHGLERPLLSTEDGYFQVTFPGPGDDLDRVRVPEGRLRVSPAVEARLNERQKDILEHVLVEGSVTRRWCVSTFGVANDTAGRDLKGLVDLGLLEVRGKARGVRYVLASSSQSTEERPT